MTKLIVNIGSGPNAKNGDPLRVAFDKINHNFQELYSSIGGVAVSIGDTPPEGAVSGTVWWDSVDGNLYVHYGSTWVEAMAPTINVTTLKSIVAASTSFSDFQTRIAAL